MPSPSRLLGEGRAVPSSSPGRSMKKNTRRTPAALFWKSTHRRPKVIDAPATVPNSPSTTMKSPGSNWPAMI